MLLFLTNLEDPVLAESFIRSIDLIRRQHLLFVNTPARPEVQPLFSNPDVKEIDDIYDKLGGHMRWQKLNELGLGLRHRGIQWNQFDEDRLASGLIHCYLTAKQQQLL